MPTSQFSKRLEIKLSVINNIQPGLIPYFQNVTCVSLHPC